MIEPQFCIKSDEKTKLHSLNMMSYVQSHLTADAKGLNINNLSVRIPGRVSEKVDSNLGIGGTLLTTQLAGHNFLPAMWQKK